jgi:hypothetical protein
MKGAMKWWVTIKRLLVLIAIMAAMALIAQLPSGETILWVVAGIAAVGLFNQMWSVLYRGPRRHFLHELSYGPHITDRKQQRRLVARRSGRSGRSQGRALVNRIGGANYSFHETADIATKALHHHAGGLGSRIDGRQSHACSTLSTSGEDTRQRR